MTRYFIIIKVVSFLLCPSYVFAEFQNNLILKDDSVYVLSKQLTTYQEAEETCQHYGGNLVQISSQEERQFFEPHLRRFYMKDQLTEVKIYQSIVNFNGDKDVYKYRKTTEPGGNDNDTTDISGYNVPPTGEFKSILLYNSRLGCTIAYSGFTSIKVPREPQGFKGRFPGYLNGRKVEDFERTVYFCWFYQRDYIKARKCDKHWEPNFELFGGTSRSKYAIKLFNLVDRQYLYSSMLTFSKASNSPIYINLNSINLPVFSDISVFTGARSDVNQSNWFWNSGTMITDPTYPTSNTSVCQQMTWPLTYDDGINLRSKECGSGESHYICRVQGLVEARVDEVKCDESSLRLSVPALIGQPNGTTIEVWVSNGAIFTFPSGETRIIRNLKQRTKYTFMISIWMPGYQRLPAEATGTTGYGVPGPVTSPHVKSSTLHKCIIAWTHEKPDDQMMGYNITVVGISGNTTISATASFISESSNNSKDQFAEVFESFSAREYTEFVMVDFLRFEIKAVSSCGKMSDSVVVNGTCISPIEKPNTFPTIAIIGIAVATAIVVILTLIFCICKRRNESNQNKNTTMSMPKIAHKPAFYDEPARADGAVDEACYVEPNRLKNYENVKNCYTYNRVEADVIYDPVA